MFLLQIIKSYFCDILLDQRSTSQNPELKLYLSNGQLKLCTKNAVYSYGNYYYNFRDCFRHLKISRQQIKDVLILGLGTGSIIQQLEQKFALTACYDAVESDPDIVALFKKFGLLFIKSKVKIYTEDAFQYVSDNTQKYDLICMDIFLDNVVPLKFETITFLQNLKHHLSDQGLLIYNRLVLDAKDIIKNEEFFKNFQQVFPEASILKLTFNWMMIAKG